MASVDEELSASLLDYSYSQVPATVLGSAACGLVIAGTIVHDGLPTDPLGPWLTAHAVLALLGLRAYYKFVRGARLSAPVRAQSLRRQGGPILGLIWGVAGLLWPVSAGVTGTAVLLATAGMAAAASSSAAADLRGFFSFVLLTFVPRLVMQGRSEWWLSILLLLYLGMATFVALRNARLLRTSLSLRWENRQLLEQARAEHIATLGEKQRAETAVAARTRFLAAASHDLRQPVQALSLFADVLEHQRDGDEREQAITAVGRTTRALSAMLESLLDVSRLDAGVVTPIPSVVPIVGLLEDIAAPLQIDAEKRGMVVQVAGAPCHVWADRTLLARVVQNLAANAVNHGGGRVLLASRRRGDHCLVQVWDQGPGIAESDRERIFEELVQLGNRARDRNKGLGLGLAMVRRLCELNEWPLTLHSRVGRGSVFAVRLPLTRMQPQVMARPMASAQRCLRVLLVEDDEDVREATSAWLASRGCELFATADGAAALACFRQMRASGASVDILITDQRLPGALSGAQLAIELRRDQPDLPVVMVTGSENLPFGETPPRGIFVLRKPVKGEALWQSMGNVLDAAEFDRR